MALCMHNLACIGQSLNKKCTGGDLNFASQGFKNHGRNSSLERRGSKYIYDINKSILAACMHTNAEVAAGYILTM